VAIVARTAGRAKAAQLGGYELLLAARVLRRVQPAGVPAEVLRLEVTRIVETKLGLWVTSDRPERALFVTRALDGDADVREALAAWRPIELLEGLAALSFAWKQTKNQASRDARAGSALATDPTLVEALAAVRAASSDRGAGIGAARTLPRANRGVEGAAPVRHAPRDVSRDLARPPPFRPVAPREERAGGQRGRGWAGAGRIRLLRLRDATASSGGRERFGKRPKICAARWATHGILQANFAIRKRKSMK
jgi:hypothetical protein